MEVGSDHHGDAGVAKSLPIRELLEDYQSLPDEQRTPELMGLHVLAVLAVMSDRDPSAAMGANGCWSRLTWAIPEWLRGGPRWIRLEIERQTARSRRASLAAQHRWKRQRRAKAPWIPPAVWSDASKGDEVLRLCTASGIITSDQTEAAATIMQRLKDRGASAALFVHALRGLTTTPAAAETQATPQPIVIESESDPLFGPSARGLRLEAKRNHGTANGTEKGVGKPPQRRTAATTGGNNVSGKQPDSAGP